MGHQRIVSLLAVATVVATGCVGDPGVRAREAVATASDRPTTVPTIATVPPASTPTSSVPTESTVSAPNPSVADPAIEFASCDGVAADGSEPPSADWECGTLVAPMDPSLPDGLVVELAVTRLAGSRSRGDALVFNPGGPGVAGVAHIWSLAETLPEDVLRLFDIVSWDPRGIGASVPAIICPTRSRWSDPALLERCGDVSGEIMSHMSTADHVEDLELLRRALGQERLNYVGYSYGTYLGAMFAATHPDRVGRFVLDGAVDPASGTADSPRFDGAPWYAADGSTAVVDRFFAICDAAQACSLGADSAARFDQLRSSIGDLPTDAYPGVDVVDGVTLDAVLEAAMLDPFNWGVVATALEDADTGDGSTVDALADLFEVSDLYFGDVVDVAAGNETLANLTIYCADFRSLPDLPEYCDGVPYPTRPGEIGPVDVAEPMLVIGTELDPSTPVQHAGRLATVLDDAVELYWDGIGHTAFPQNSLCIDDAVTSYLLDGVLPVDGTHCEFVDGLSGDDEIGDYLFELPPFYVQPWIETALEPEWGDKAACGAERLSVAGDRIVVHVVLGVASAVATAAIDKAAAACR